MRWMQIVICTFFADTRGNVLISYHYRIYIPELLVLLKISILMSIKGNHTKLTNARTEIFLITKEGGPDFQHDFHRNVEL